MSVANALGYNNFPVPVGTLISYAGQLTPSTFLLCDGSVLKIAEYPVLYGVIGTVYNESDVVIGTDEFTLPNLLGKYVKGASSNGNVTQVSSQTGTLSYTVEANNVPALTAFTSNAFNNASDVFNDTGHSLLSTGTSITKTSDSGDTSITVIGIPAAIPSPQTNTTYNFDWEVNYNGTGTPQSQPVTISSANPASLGLMWCIKAYY